VEFKQEGIGSKTIVVSFTEKNVLNRHHRSNTTISSPSGNTLLKACKESSLFKEILSEIGDADIKLHVDSVRNGQLIPILLFISAVTLTIIPSYSEEERNVVYSFFDGKGKLLKSYKRRAKFTQLFHILFFPFLPFKYNGLSADEIIFEDITKSVLDEANRDGLFK
jgi:hypothetical protein